MPNSQPGSLSRIRIGCAGLPQGLKRARYFEQLPFLETTDTYRSLPRSSILERWRTTAVETRAGRGTAAGFGLVALSSISDPASSKAAQRSAAPAAAEAVGHFRDTEAVRQATEVVASAARKLDAEVVLFRSPPGFTPSAANRQAMQRYFSEIAPAGTFGHAAVAWEPQGLWELEEAVAVADELGVICACDPLAGDPTRPEWRPADVLPRQSAYFRITGLGRPRRPLDETTLESLLLQAEEFDRCWLVFSTVDKRVDARNCQRLLDATTAAGEPE